MSELIFDLLPPNDWPLATFALKASIKDLEKGIKMKPKIIWILFEVCEAKRRNFLTITSSIPRLRKGYRNQNQCVIDDSLLRSCWFKRTRPQDLFSEWGDWELLFIIKAHKCDIILKICVCFHLLLWADASQNNKFLLRYQILFHKRFVLQINSGISCSAEAKVLKKRFAFGKNFYVRWSIVSKVSPFGCLVVVFNKSFVRCR